MFNLFRKPQTAHVAPEPPFVGAHHEGAQYVTDPAALSEPGDVASTREPNVDAPATPESAKHERTDLREEYLSASYVRAGAADHDSMPAEPEPVEALPEPRPPQS